LILGSSFAKDTPSGKYGSTLLSAAGVQIWQKENVAAFTATVPELS
jgi:hypothetical protein